MAAVTAASYAGAAFAFAVTPGLVSEFGWPSAFYSFGAIALLWAPFWFALPDHREPRGVDDEIEDAETRRFIAESSATATKPPAVVRDLDGAHTSQGSARDLRRAIHAELGHVRPSELAADVL